MRGTSHREIADAANVGPSNIRNYFPGKEGLFRTVVQPVVGPAAVSDEGREISLGFPVPCYGVLYFTYRSDARRIPHASPDI
ncbi:TetR family transcriptional regulator [Alistipes communis]|uniref:TetR/AcrR family transcriptional regulator n=1 Tax=Alistipes communis TaxID=2585118 RepID=UPI001D08F38B|nr:TetR/AcrR family transcriptional regulator [Alistipes communis]MBD9350449.1 TetR/AcrR family transcriptional regulator [Alistipes communis]MCB6995291.1 TetR family transcriptional regulator [Alistipes communis]